MTWMWLRRSTSALRSGSTRASTRQARSDLELALAIRERTQPSHPETAATLALLGLQFWLEGDLLQAREFSRRAVAMAESTLRRDHPRLGSYLKNLALAVQDVGDLATARDLKERALRIAERTYGAEHPEVAGRLSDLANTLFLQGEYATARSLYERALGIYDRVAPDHADAATVAYNIANLNATLGDFLEARRYFQRAIRSWERGLGTGHPVLAWALSSFAETLAERGLDREAKPLYERALSIRERRLVKDHPYIARTLAYLAVTLARLGEIRRATELSIRALRIWEVAGSADPAGFADSLMIGATIQERRHDWATARRSFQRALDIRMPMFGPNHPAVAEARAGLAATLAVLGDTPEAALEAMQAEEIGRTHLRLTLAYLPERQALEYAAKRPRGLDLALSLDENVDGRRSAFDAVVRGRSLTLDEMASRRLSARHRNSDAAAEPLWSDLAATRQRFANLVIRGPAGQRPDQYAALVENARQEKELAERALAAKSTTFRPESARQEIGIEQVHAQLPQDSALVSFLKYLPEHVQCHIRRRRHRLIRGATALAPDRDLVRRLRPPPSGRRTSRRSSRFCGQPRGSRCRLAAGDDGRRHESSGRRARRTVLPRAQPYAAPEDLGSPGPASGRRATRLRRARRRAQPRAAGGAAAARGRYLLDDGPVIHYLSAERDLVPADGPFVESRRGLLAVGGPAFADGSVFASLVSHQTAQSAPVCKPERPRRHRRSHPPRSLLPVRFVALVRTAPASNRSNSPPFRDLVVRQRTSESLANVQTGNWRDQIS